jgi:hypothetical protein
MQNGTSASLDPDKGVPLAFLIIPLESLVPTPWQASLRGPALLSLKQDFDPSGKGSQGKFYPLFHIRGDMIKTQNTRGICCRLHQTLRTWYESGWYIPKYPDKVTDLRT